MIRRQDQQRFVPVAVGLHPLRDDFDGIVAGVDRADRGVNIVVVVGPVDVAGFNHDPERFLIAAKHREGSRRHLGERWIFCDISS